MTVFNDPTIKFNVTSGQANADTRVMELDDTVDVSTVHRGLWLVMNADRKLDFTSSTTGVTGAKVVLIPGQSASVSAFAVGNKGRTISVVDGPFRGSVGARGYDDALDTVDYAPHVKLKVTAAGILIPVAAPTDIVTAISEGIDEEGLLHFTTYGV